MADTDAAIAVWKLLLDLWSKLLLFDKNSFQELSVRSTNVLQNLTSSYISQRV